jgi:hypothetical protein
MASQFWDSYREELIATSLVLILTVFGSFYLTYRYTRPQKQLYQEKVEEMKRQEVAKKIDEAMRMVAGLTTDPQLSAVNQAASPTIVPLPTPTLAPQELSSSYGSPGHYVFDEYTLVIDNPRVVVNLLNGKERRFIADVTITNRSVARGLPTTFSASIIKETTIVVAKAPMASSDNKIIMPGEELSLQIRIALIEDNDVNEVIYEPQGLVDTVTHLLKR